MLLVKTKIDQSPIHGIGLFADEDIPKGTVVWEFDPLIDKAISPEDIKSLRPLARELIDTYAFYDNGKYVLCGDHARFTNHSDDPNLGSTPDTSFALRDIKKGEEITDNYNSYDQEEVMGEAGPLATQAGEPLSTRA